jgi:hypothetical protein
VIFFHLEQKAKDCRQKARAFQHDHFHWNTTSLLEFRASSAGAARHGHERDCREEKRELGREEHRRQQACAERHRELRGTVAAIAPVFSASQSRHPRRLLIQYTQNGVFV